MSTVAKTHFPVLGMTCASCAASVESMLRAQEGIVSASVNFADGSAMVEYDQKAITHELMQKAVRSIGYDLKTDASESSVIEVESTDHYKELKRNLILASAFGLPVVVMSMLFMGSWNPVLFLLTVPVLFWFGRGFFIRAWGQIKHRNPGMDTLVAMSTGTAFLFSAFNTFYADFWHRQGIHPHVYYESVVVIIVFILLGKFLEERAKGKTSGALKKLISLQPRSVVLVDDRNQNRNVPLADVVPGQRVMVRPGDRVPFDGRVESGTSFVDESSITGEPVPVEKIKGLPVFAGTSNTTGSFVMVVDKAGSETVLAHIIQAVRHAQSSKAPIQRLADKVAGIFVPVVLVIAVLTLLGWVLLGGEIGITLGMQSFITVLIIACPCALGLATPTALMVGIGKGAEHGILVRDAESLEQAVKLNAIALDKTGTITEGKPSVNEIRWVSSEARDQYAGVFRSLEMRSAHPLAEAIASSLDSKEESLDSFLNEAGQGVSGTYRAAVVRAGSMQWLTNSSVTVPDTLYDLVKQWRAEAMTVVGFARNAELLAVVSLRDKEKPGSAEAITELKSMGMKTYLLTGDNAETAKAVAGRVGIDHVRAELLPQDKTSFIKALKAKGLTVAMAGDGINDAEALAEAHISIAMGKGSDLAIDVSKITLMGSDLRTIGRALRITRDPVRTIWMNLILGVVSNVVAIPLAAGVMYPVYGFLLNPMIAGAAMAMSSLSVVGNSLLLRRARI